jgi:hypothetical protein
VLSPDTYIAHVIVEQCMIVSSTFMMVSSSSDSSSTGVRQSLQQCLPLLQRCILHEHAAEPCLVSERHSGVAVVLIGATLSLH